ncbi:MAG TPA: alpha/beta hydrolase [Thermoanaerobaculia bacterium]|nr:alpha/beta hydrolase [Thermoanaerobaculia bacterium]
MRRFFFAWAIVSTLWVANKMRTRGVAEEMLRTSPAVGVREGDSTLEFRPVRTHHSSALIFFCGAGVSAHAYAPLLRPIAEAGYPVFVIKLPYRFAPFDSHKETAIARARSVIAAHPAVGQWVVSGHSLGGALTARAVRSGPPAAVAAIVLVGTTHPRSDDLSALRIPVTKIYASNDGVAPVDRIQATRHLLPAHTRWVEIRGGNHSQFGHYGHQLLDGKATITRAAQQTITRSTILEALKAITPDN